MAAVISTVLVTSWGVTRFCAHSLLLFLEDTQARHIAERKKRKKEQEKREQEEKEQEQEQSETPNWIVPNEIGQSIGRGTDVGGKSDKCSPGGGKPWCFGLFW